jgi:hypothetical protein
MSCTVKNVTKAVANIVSTNKKFVSPLDLIFSYNRNFFTYILTIRQAKNNIYLLLTLDHFFAHFILLIFIFHFFVEWKWNIFLLLSNLTQNFDVIQSVTFAIKWVSNELHRRRTQLGHKFKRLKLCISQIGAFWRSLSREKSIYFTAWKHWLDMEMRYEIVESELWLDLSAHNPHENEFLSINLSIIFMEKWKIVVE